MKVRGSSLMVMLRGLSVELTVRLAGMPFDVAAVAGVLDVAYSADVFVMIYNRHVLTYTRQSWEAQVPRGRPQRLLTQLKTAMLLVSVLGLDASYVE